MNLFQVNNNIINLNFIRKIDHEQPRRDNSNRLVYNVEFIFYNGETEKYEMTQEKFRDLTSIRKKQLNTFQVNDHFINLSMIQKITHGKAYDNDDEVQCFNVEFIYQDGKSEQHEMTYKAFHQLIERCDDKMTFVVDDYINTVLAEEIC